MAGVVSFTKDTFTKSLHEFEILVPKELESLFDHNLTSPLLLSIALVLILPFRHFIEGLRQWLIHALILKFSQCQDHNYKPPCEQILEEAEKYNSLHGHENRGALSRQAGFAPVFKHTGQLPALFQPWETVANSMDLLLHTQTVRIAVENLPTLPAGSDVLPDQYLVRASIILSHLAYIYVNGEVRTKKSKSQEAVTPHVVPAPIRQPWAEVCRRLGRQHSFMTYTDAVSSSHVRDDTLAMEQTTIDNIQPLVPFQRTRQSAGFLGTMFETVAWAQPVLCDVLAAHRAVLRADKVALSSALSSIHRTVSHVRQVTLPKLSPYAKSKHYVDPIAWVKSVANLGIHWPEIKHIPGPSGTGHPFFHLLDVFVGRKSYSGMMGHEAQRTRENLPQHWRELFEAVEQISVAQFVQSDQQLQRQWKKLCDVYADNDGLLGFHKRKVFGYLYIAFRVGRSSTINGFAGNTRQEPWNLVADALDEARKHRVPDEHAEELISNSASSDREIAASDLLERVSSDTGIWIAARGQVYDITAYVKHHPGGHHILRNCAGRDVTQDLETARHFDDERIRAIMKRHLQGTLSIKTLHNTQLQRVYDMAIALGYQINDLASTFSNHRTFINCKLSGLDVEGALSPFKLNVYADMEEHLRLEVVAAAAAYSGSFLEALHKAVPPKMTQEVAVLSERIRQIEGKQQDSPAEMLVVSADEVRRLIGMNAELFSAMQRGAVSTVKVLESACAAAEKLDESCAALMVSSMASILEQLARLGRVR